MWPFSLLSVSSSRPRSRPWFSGPKREYIVCTECRNWFYLTSLEIRYFDETEKPFPDLCRICLRKARERDAAGRVVAVVTEDDRLIANG